MAITIATINCNGMRDQSKQKTIQLFQQVQDIDILFLQETHLDPSTDQTCKNWKGNTVWAGQSHYSSGVAILLKPSKAFSIQKILADSNGRYIILNCNYKSKPFTLVNIYCPDRPSLRKQFVKQFKMLLDKFPCQGNIIFGGDFNFVNDLTRDRIGGNPQSYHKIGNSEIKQINDNLSLQDAWLLNVNKSNNNFTYHNHDHSIQSRLDRIYLSNNLANKTTNIKNVPLYFSDHNALIITISSFTSNKSNSYWKINNSILKDPEYQNQITGLWECWKLVKTNYTPEQWWDLGKIKIKDLTISYCIKQSQKRKQKIQELYNQFNQTNITNEDKCTLEAQLETINKNFSTVIKSKIALANDFEVPNQYFFKMEQLKQKKKAIKKLKINNITTENQDLIQQHILNNYKETFAHQDINTDMATKLLSNTKKCLTDPQKQQLDKPLTKQEIRKSLNQTKDNKSPGLDGLSFEFYAAFWDLLGDDLTEILNHGLETGEMTTSQRRAVITLIPKNGDETNLTNWRPISLLNTDLKLATKSLANRLGDILPTIINDSQTCSIKNREIYHHTLLIRDIIEFSKTSNQPTYIISFDQEKAFDKVNWDFLLLTLNHFKFPKTFINQIKAIYKNIQSNFNINGKLTPFIAIERGVRQGCPLSLLLYILIAEILGNSIMENTKITGFKLPNVNNFIKHIQFADDLTTITHDLQSIHEINQTLNEFALATGSTLNKEKTKGIALNHPTGIPPQLPNINIKWNHPETKILGITFTEDNQYNQMKNWENTAVKIENKVKFLKLRNLSMLGKTHIINTLVISKALYLCRIFPPKPQILKRINNTIFTYLWHGKTEKIKREILYLPKSLGGLGLLPLKTHATALQIITFLEVDQDKPPPFLYLALNWMTNRKYISNKWPKIQNTIKKNNLRSPYYYSYHNFHRNMITIIKKDIKKVTTKKIRQTLIGQLNTESPSSSAISALTSNSTTYIDWKHTLSSNFNLTGSPKYATTFLFLIHNALPSLTNLNKWNRENNSDICPLCMSDSETNLHIFTCTYWQSVWTESLSALRLLNINITNVEQAVTASIQPTNPLANSITFTTMFYIYQARNQIIFDEKTIQPKTITNIILTSIKKDILTNINTKTKQHKQLHLLADMHNPDNISFFF